MSGKRAADWLTLERRGKIYRIITAAGAVALIYGWVDGRELEAWLPLAAAILGTGTASAFTPAVRERGQGVADL